MSFTSSTYVRPECQFEVHLPGKLVLAHQCKPIWILAHEFRVLHSKYGAKQTITLSFCQHFCKVDFTFSNEVRFARIIGIACQPHGLSTFDFPRCLVIFWRRGWRCVISLGGSIQNIISILENRKPNFLVPFRVLSTSFDGFCSSLFTVESYSTIWILLPYVALIG